MADIFNTLVQRLEEEKLTALVTVIKGPSLGRKLLIYPDRNAMGDLGSKELNKQVIDHTIKLFKKLDSDRTSFTITGETNEVFVDMYPPPPKIYIVGAVHIAIPLVNIANTCGFHTVVIDARGAFATKERFPHADELIIGWPSEKIEKLGIDESTYVVMLTHDEKFDNPALKVVLQSNARYVGALGSKKTHANRVNELKEMGLTDEQIARIHAPIGLSIGSRGPEEIALAIMAEIVAVSHGVKL
jgi:xanthine dehydrogenase accessory factor